MLLGTKVFRLCTDLKDEWKNKVALAVELSILTTYTSVHVTLNSTFFYDFFEKQKKQSTTESKLLMAS